MGILGKKRKSGHGQTTIRDFCLQTIRFNKFLENARALLDLFSDGREKIHGEYIFDRHYVVSLIDSVVDRLGMLVYDASVLAPEQGKSLFAAYDQQKEAALKLIQTGNTSINAADDIEDPEYRLLADALEMFGGATTPPGKGTVMAFMRQAFIDVLQRLKSSENAEIGLFEQTNLRATDMNLYLVDLWQDALSLPASSRTAADTNCIPLRHLLMNVDRKRTVNSSSSHAPDRVPWAAAVSEHRLSLNRHSPDARFRLEASASGHDPSDFIFIFTDRSDLPDKILPAGFHLESDRSGVFAWNLSMSSEEIEKSLTTIGHKLFDSVLWQAK